MNIFDFPKGFIILRMFIKNPFLCKPKIALGAPWHPQGVQKLFLISCYAYPKWLLGNPGILGARQAITK